MKIMKKALAAMLSVVMMLAMSVTAFADTNTYTITVSENSNHQYEIYQIFTGDYSDGKLTNEKWGANGTGTMGDAVDDTTLDTLKKVDNATDTAKLDVIKKCINWETSPVATVTKDTSYNAVPGYYLIKDVDGSVSGKDAYTLYIAKVVNEGFEITPKSSVPSFEKKIKDTNDSTGETDGWQDSADYDIGDQVPFQLKGTVASDYDNYKTYYFAFHDKEETGLAFNKDSVSVFVDGTPITSGYEVITDKDKMSETDDANKCTFEVVFNDLKTLKDAEGNALVHKDSVITVEYTSELTKSANIGSEGNVNKAKLEFSNNPNEEQNGENKPGTGETPWDNVIVFTYKVVVNKIDEDGKALAGAGFTLKKVVKGGDPVVIDTIEAGKTTKFEFKGLDDGDYILEETTVPAGYNKIDPIEFTVNADHTLTWDGTDRNQVLKSLTGTTATGEITFTANTDKSELATDVVNKQGVELPSTGGIGTTIFYVIGGVLMAGAAVLLITRKRMESEK